MTHHQIFLDYASATPVAPEVLRTMQPFFTDNFYNPSSLYHQARSIRDVIDSCRDRVAMSIGAHSDEIVFTTGGTEADNLALFGVMNAHTNKQKHIIVSAIEHQAILNTAQELERLGVRISILPVDQSGIVDLKRLASLITNDTVLVSVMLANNEIGVIQPLKEIAKLAHAHGSMLHTDASQAFGLMPISVALLHVDLLTINSGKIYGPKGAGALYIKRKTVLHPQIFGGAQERSLRPGTENVPAIVGFAKACELVIANLATEPERLKKLRDRLMAGLLKIPGTRLHGDYDCRLVNNINIGFSDVEGDALLLFLDEAGIMVSAGSACKATDVSPSHVLMALGLSAKEAKSSLRFSLGRGTTEADIDYVLEVLPSIVERLRK